MRERGKRYEKTMNYLLEGNLISDHAAFNGAPILCVVHRAVISRYDSSELKKANLEQRRKFQEKTQIFWDN